MKCGINFLSPFYRSEIQRGSKLRMSLCSLSFIIRFVKNKYEEIEDRV